MACDSVIAHWNESRVNGNSTASFVIKLTDKQGQKGLVIVQEESKTEYRKVGPAMSRVRTLAQPPLDGEQPGPAFSQGH